MIRNIYCGQNESFVTNYGDRQNSLRKITLTYYRKYQASPCA